MLPPPVPARCPPRPDTPACLLQRHREQGDRDPRPAIRDPRPDPEEANAQSSSVEAVRLPERSEGSTSPKDLSNRTSSPAARPGVAHRVPISSAKPLLPAPAPGVSPAGLTTPLGQPLGCTDPAPRSSPPIRAPLRSPAERGRAGVPPPTRLRGLGTSRRREECTGKPQGMGVCSPSS